VAITGGVLSHSEAFDSLGELWGGLAFHAVTSSLGAYLIQRGKSPNRQRGTEGAETGLHRVPVAQ